MKYFFIGIMGSGMRALASLMLQMGYCVSGMDTKKALKNLNLIDNKVKVYPMFSKYLDSDYTYVIGNSFMNSRIFEVIKRKGYKYISYPALIERLSFKTKIAVCGSHGKTTVTKSIAALGGMSSLVGDGTASFVNDMEFVFEACEYQNTFLNYFPTIGVFLNVDYDHTDYFKTSDEYTNAYYKFISNTDIQVYSFDNPILRQIMPSNAYGYSIENKDCYLYASLSLKDSGYEVTLDRLNKTFQTPYFTKWQVQNMLASFTALLILGRDIDELIKRIPLITNPKRRNNEYIIGTNILVNDYAHHPSQLRAIYELYSTKYKDKRIIIIYEGHTFERNNHFRKEIKESLQKFDECLLYPLFTSNREKRNRRAKSLYRFFGFKPVSIKEIDSLMNEKNQVIIFAGAGQIDTYFNRVLDKYMENKKVM